jgi:hypothetical protein
MHKLLKKKIAEKASAEKRAAAKETATPKRTRYVYYFGEGKADGNGLCSVATALYGFRIQFANCFRIRPCFPGLT